MARASETGETVKTAARLSLPLTPDGTAVDWEHVRQSTAEKFEGLLRTDPLIRKAYDEQNGTGETAGVDPFGGVTEENVRKLLDTVAKANATLLQIVGAKYIKHPLLRDTNNKPLPLVLEPDVLKQMEFSEKQHAELDPRATRIAKKYEHKMPGWLREHFDLYVFGSMFIAYTAENAKAVIGAQVRRDLARAQEAFVKARTPKNPQPDSDVQAQPVNGRDLHPTDEFNPPSMPEEQAGA